MKKLLFAALLAVFTFASAFSQSTKLVSKTISAADTVTFSSVPSNIKAFQYTYTETSGTSAGSIIFEGTINGTWVAIGSATTITDVTTPQTVKVDLSGTTFLSYRFRNTNTSSATGTVKVAWLRRTDE